MVVMAHSGDGGLKPWGIFLRLTKGLSVASGHDFNDAPVHFHIIADQVHEHDSSRKIKFIYLFIYFPVGRMDPISKSNRAILVNEEALDKQNTKASLKKKSPERLRCS